MVRTWLLRVGLLVACVGFTVTWNYDEDTVYGPHNWNKIYADECDPARYPRQSPIDIEKGLLRYDPTLTQMRMNNFEASNVTFQVKNTGHTIEFDIIDNDIETEGGPVGDVHYFVLNLHFHWGDNNPQDGHGSEHTILGQQHRAEMHIVHVNHKHIHLGQPDILQKDDGLLVLGIFIDVANASKGQVPNPEFTKITEAVKLVRDRPFSAQNLSTGYLNVGNLLPSNLKDYFTYPGGLTTPNCHGAVTWVVYSQVIYITQDQLDEFFKVKDEDGNDLINIWRPPQPVNGRLVRTTSMLDGISSASSPRTNFLNLLAAMFIWMQLFK